MAPRSSFPLRALACAVADSSGRRTWFTMMPPTGSPASRRCCTPSAVSCTGISSSSVTRCTAVSRDAMTSITRVGLRPDRAGPGEPGDLGVDVEEPRDASGGRRVHDDRVVDRYAVPLAPHRLLGLAGEQYVADPGRDGRGEVDRAHPAQRGARATQVVEHLEVLDERLLGVDGEGEDLAASRRDGHASLGVRQRRYVEDLGQALPGLDLDDEHLAPTRRQGQREGGRDRRLPGSALARDDVQAHGVPVGAPSSGGVGGCRGHGSERTARGGSGACRAVPGTRGRPARRAPSIRPRRGGRRACAAGSRVGP